MLDEFTYPLKWGWVDIEDVVEVLLSRPGTQHVVITGRDAPRQLLDAARPSNPLRRWSFRCPTPAQR